MVATLIQGPAVVATLGAQRVGPRVSDGFEAGKREGKRILATHIRGSLGTPAIERLREAIADADSHCAEVAEAADFDERYWEYCHDYAEGMQSVLDDGE